MRKLLEKFSSPFYFLTVISVLTLFRAINFLYIRRPSRASCSYTRPPNCRQQSKHVRVIKLPPSSCVFPLRFTPWGQCSALSHCSSTTHLYMLPRSMKRRSQPISTRTIMLLPAVVSWCRWSTIVSSLV